MVTGIGTAKSAASVMALGLDERFDLSKAYWIVAGIAGIDPEDATMGSAVWSEYLVDGDLSHEIDPREIQRIGNLVTFLAELKGRSTPRKPTPSGEIFSSTVA